MKKVLALSILMNIILSACDCSYQYDVYVKNSTSGNLEISFQDKSDPLSKSLVIKPGENKLIISSGEIKVPEGCTGIQSDHALFVAEYIRAKNEQGVSSNLQWGDPSIAFNREDIQQGSFLMEFTKEDFE